MIFTAIGRFSDDQKEKVKEEIIVKQMKKALSCILAAAMTVTMFSTPVYAQPDAGEAEQPAIQEYSGFAEEADDAAPATAAKNNGDNVELSKPTLNGEEYDNFDALIKTLPKLLKDGKLKAENVINLTMVAEAKKAVTIPKSDYTFRITGEKLTLGSTTITANSDLIIDCEVAAAKEGKTVSLKAAAGKTITINKENVFGTISGAKGSKLVLGRSITVDTVKTFDSVDSGANMITLNKSMSGAAIGTAFFSYTATTAKKVSVPAITGVFTVNISDIAVNGTKLFTYSGKDNLDRAKVEVFSTLDGKNFEAFVYKKEVRAEIPDAMKLNGYDCPSWEYALLQMTEAKDYIITVKSVLEIDKMTMPKNVSSLTISGGDSVKTIDLKKGGTISAKYPIVLENIELTGAKAVNVKPSAKLTINGTVFVNGSVSATELASTKAGTHLTAQSLAVTKYGITAGSKPITLKIVDKYYQPVVFTKAKKGDTVLLKTFKIDKNSVYADGSMLLDPACGDFTIYYKNGKLILLANGETPEPPALKSISVTPPTKTTYRIGEALDVTGGVVELTYSNGTKSTTPLTLGMCTGFSSTTAGAKTVTVKYQGKKATFKVTVEKDTTPTVKDKIKVFCYYDFKNISPEKDTITRFAEKYNGEVEMMGLCASNSYTEQLGILIAAGNSPDIVRYEYDMLGYAANNSFQPLDNYIDPGSALWKDVKGVADLYAFKGKHYLYPTQITAGYGITYNTENIKLLGVEDPMDLYFKGQWTWDKFNEMCQKWAALSAQNGEFISAGEDVPYLFAASTGTPAVGFNGYAMTNNLKNANVQRALNFFETLCKNGYVTPDWKAPSDPRCYADNSVLFFAMPLEWAIDEGQKILFNKKIPGEIRGVPLPKDPNSTTHETLATPYGYLIPAGAANVKGAVNWITCAREYSTDAAVIKARRDALLYNGSYYYIKCITCKHQFDSEYGTAGEVCPECGTARKAKYKLVYSENQMRVLNDMCDPKNFNIVHNWHRSLGEEFIQIFFNMNQNVKYGETFNKQIEEYNGRINHLIEQFNTDLK